ncbi:hypothetical protein NDU88_003857 [Pleurodeles waltl]|uniref:Uncharacterized protein n=1 Tax=Pleurodeles waltl TaxID=8319 RepID=A0AAV7UZM7_PLEWA|nr:hypothetical protein NDU88_003857 [Pleurodeles waltl]
MSQYRDRGAVRAVRMSQYRDRGAVRAVRMSQYRDRGAVRARPVGWCFTALPSGVLRLRLSAEMTGTHCTSSPINRLPEGQWLP